MSSFNDRWTVTQHVIPAAHIRGFARGVINEAQSPRLRLAVKQYVPKGRRPKPGDVTLLFAHGVGSNKESYEPFFDGLLLIYPSIRTVWIPDIAWHGDSYLLNEDIIGDEPHWLDSSRDFVQMINHFQEQMPPPIVGISQSWGAVTIMHASMMNPRLFDGLAVLEPTLVTGYPGQDDKKHIIHGMMSRRDTWPTREEARRHLLRNPYYGAFDPVVFERVIEFDLRDIVRDGKPAVTLKTPKSMEAYSLGRPWPPLPGSVDVPEQRLLDLEAQGKYQPTYVIQGFHRPEVQPFLAQLPSILAPVHIVWAGKSYHRRIPEYRDRLLRAIGTGPEGSGGWAQGQVTESFVEDSGHPLPLEKPALAAASIVSWLEKVVQEWKDAMARRVKGPKMHAKVVNPAWVERANKL